MEEHLQIDRNTPSFAGSSCSGIPETTRRRLSDSDVQWIVNNKCRSPSTSSATAACWSGRQPPTAPLRPSTMITPHGSTRSSRPGRRHAPLCWNGPNRGPRRTESRLQAAGRIHAEYPERGGAEAGSRAGPRCSPGQDIGYVVVDDEKSSRDPVALAHGDIESYDASYYETQLIRAVESVLAPLGWDRTEIRRELEEPRSPELVAFADNKAS